MLVVIGRASRTPTAIVGGTDLCRPRPAAVSGNHRTPEGLAMRFTRLSDFGRELLRPFEVHENCYDCAGLCDGCRAWPATRDFACHTFNRLPDVTPGTRGQRFHATARKLDASLTGEVPPTTGQTEQPPTQTCTHPRRGDPAKWRKYMRGYMKRRRAAALKSQAVSDVPFPASGTLSIGPGIENVKHTRSPAGVPASAHN